MATDLDFSNPIHRSLLFGRNSDIYAGGMRDYTLLAQRMGRLNGEAAVLNAFRPSKHIFAFDVEATGFQKNAQITQLAGLALDPNLNPVEGGMIDLLVKPTVPLEGKAYEIMSSGGITRDLLSKQGLDRDAAREAILAKLEGLHSSFGQMQPMGSNVRYDLDRLSELIGEENVSKYFDTDNLLDTVALGHAYKGAVKPEGLHSASVRGLAKHLGIEFKGAHNAIADIFATVRSYRGLMNRLGADIPINNEALDAANESFRHISPPITHAPGIAKAETAIEKSVADELISKKSSGSKYAFAGASMIGALWLMSRHSESEPERPIQISNPSRRSAFRSQNAQFAGPMVQFTPPTHPNRSRSERG